MEILDDKIFDLVTKLNSKSDEQILFIYTNKRTAITTEGLDLMKFDPGQGDLLVQRLVFTALHLVMANGGDRKDITRFMKTISDDIKLNIQKENESRNNR